MVAEAAKVKTIVSDLRVAHRHRFPATGRTLAAPARHGVYLIYDPDGVIAHVGRTTRAREGLLQRLRAHLNGRSSFVNKYLKGQRKRLREGFKYSWIEVPGARTRALAEHYAVGTLCPLHLGTGESAS